jgi:hypothetical protein
MTNYTITADTAVTAGIDTARLGERAVALLHYSLGVVIALAAVAGIARFMDTGLPSCASARADRTLQTIVRHNGFAGASIEAKRLVARDAAAATCSATVTAADGSRHTMSYRIFRNDQGRVRISATFGAL